MPLKEQSAQQPPVQAHATQHPKSAAYTYHEGQIGTQGEAWERRADPYEDFDPDPPRSRTSTINYQKQPIQTQIRVRHTQVPRRATAQEYAKLSEPAYQHPQPASYRPLSQRLKKGLFIALSLFVSVIICAILLNLAWGWFQTSQDDAHYGRPRTFQCDALVGHGDDPQHLSHFIAMNLNRQVQVLEFPGGDSSKVKIYLGPLLALGQELAPVTLEFKDLNHDGKPDMLITVDTIRLAFINEHGTFRPLHEGERVSV